MISKYETKDLKINSNIGGKKKGDVIKVKVDGNGTIVDRYWRDRARDSKIDRCVEFVQKKKPTSNQ